MAKPIDRERDRLLDQQRALFRFLSKSARKREPADPEAAAARIEAELDDLPDLAAQVQARIDDAWPDAPRLINLLHDPDPQTIAAVADYDWVQTGIYSFGLPPTKTRPGSKESADHRWLKEWAAAHPQRVAAPADSVAVTERWFPSGDECDVAFFADREVTLVQVCLEGADYDELRRTVFSLIKLRAVLHVEDQIAVHLRRIRSIILFGGAIPDEIRPLAQRFRVLLISQSHPPPVVLRRERLRAEAAAKAAAEQQQAEQGEQAQAEEQETEQQAETQDGG